MPDHAGNRGTVHSDRGASRSPAYQPDPGVGQRSGPRRSPRSAAAEEVRPEVGSPPVTAGRRALHSDGLGTFRSRRSGPGCAARADVPRPQPIRLRIRCPAGPSARLRPSGRALRLPGVSGRARDAGVRAAAGYCHRAARVISSSIRWRRDSEVSRCRPRRRARNTTVQPGQAIVLSELPAASCGRYLWAHNGAPDHGR